MVELIMHSKNLGRLLHAYTELEGDFTFPMSIPFIAGDVFLETKDPKKLPWCQDLFLCALKLCYNLFV